MNTVKICDNVYYVGVNDRVTVKFENMWPLPCGVTYNSYVVAAEKTALIDTCRDGFGEQYLQHVADIIGEGKTIDYLIVNHMEPDHSGLIATIIEKYPNTKIVTNKTAIGMIKGFYHISDEDRFMTIANGAALDLGGVTLQFAMTPMVHWPETMMTYIPERKLLFSGDAFGCFGALNEQVIDSEIGNLDIYFEEMYRYYSNIVGKYGASVTRALNSLASLELDYICSTHGPIWHSQIAKVVDTYARLAKWEPEDGVTIVYGTMYGNTRTLAEKMAEKIKEAGISPVKIHEAHFEDLSFMIRDAFRYRGLIIGSPTYSLTLFPPVAAFVRAMEVREIKNKVMSIFGSYAWVPAALKELDIIAANNKWNIASKMTMNLAMSEKSEAELDSFIADFIDAYKQ